ncbi:AraC family transcriptional regulator [Bacillus sp. P14.5]|uniref:AraC family transcriptional regulator n=1 Tax=Bacillus sp. P14.5 TaxID=1983400 RepID=UPI0013B059D5|nr:AraC family transcriptional regulator [Bacillus sp. P14.5]
MIKIKSKPFSNLRKRLISLHAICYIKNGKGDLVINGESYKVTKGSLFIFTPNMIVEGKANGLEPIEYDLILFSCSASIKHKKFWQDKEYTLPIHREQKLGIYESEVKKCLTQLSSINSEGETILAGMERNNILNALLLLLLRNNQNKKVMRGNSMDHVVAYLKEHYKRDIKIEDLAKLAGFSISHFTRQFKRHTGQTPTDYLLELRMTEARRLLIASEMTVREVAGHIGFKDEHYFSRVFKKVEGVSPSIYLKSKCKRIATLDYGYDDNLIALGINPVARLSYKSMVTNYSPIPVLTGQGKQMVELDDHANVFEKLLKAKPDMIIASNLHNDYLTIKSIAPAAVLDNGVSPKDSFLKIARLLGKQKEAEEWIQKYDDKLNSAIRIIEELGERQTAYFLRVRPSFYRIYGMDNQLGNLLYKELNLDLPGNFNTTQWAADLQLEELLNYNPDHIFIMVDPGDLAHNQMTRLVQSEKWKQLEAVKNHNVHNAADFLFKSQGIIGRMWVIDKVAGSLKIG